MENKIIEYITEENCSLIEKIIDASEKGDLNEVKQCVKNGINVHILYALPLRCAACNGHLEVVKYLIEECGADVHAFDDSALHLANGKGHLEVVKYLVEDCEFVDRFDLEWTIYNVHLENVKYLVEDTQRLYSRLLIKNKK